MLGQQRNLVSGRSVAKAERTKWGRYLDAKGEICIWNGKGWRCLHRRERSHCKDCGGKSICLHGRRRSVCKDCGGGSICDHGRIRSQCKECGGAASGASGASEASGASGASGDGACKHGNSEPQCKDCSSVCEHNRMRLHCKECAGESIKHVGAILEGLLMLGKAEL
eukprot:GSChrysophyteH2.ASY1.ANO1.314.1 assembled CDS